jgi:hypothetical protein
MNTHDEKPREAHRARSPLHASYPRTPPTAAPTTHQDAAEGRSRQKKRHDKRLSTQPPGRSQPATVARRTIEHAAIRSHCPACSPPRHPKVTPPRRSRRQKRRRHPIRGIWGFHPGERGRKELGVEPRHRLQGGSARSAVVAVTSPPVKGFPRAKAPSSIHPDEATDPVRPGPITSGMGATWTRSSSSDPAEGRRGGHRAATPSHRLLTTPAAKERGPQHRRTPPAQIGAALTSRGRRPRCRSSPREGEAAKSSPPPSLAATNGLPAVASGGGEGKDEDGRGSRGARVSRLPCRPRAERRGGRNGFSSTFNTCMSRSVASWPSPDPLQ